MDKTLGSFLVDLATDAAKLAEYARDREGYLERAGLSDEAKQAILSGDQERVSGLVGASRGGHTKKLAIKDYKVKKKKKKKKAKKKAAKKKARKKK